jgi:hypothetical protein
MKSMQRNNLMFALVATLAMPATLLAADGAKAEHCGHHPGQTAAASSPAQAAPAATQDRIQAMRARMLEIRASKDPEQRKQMMEAQMKDMETMMQDGSCPMMAGGMMRHGAAGGDDMMAKRMDMMQMMMQMRMGPGVSSQNDMMQRGMGPGMPVK